jgi:nuclear transport factor 2 (NTF2) superfamily protein
MFPARSHSVWRTHAVVLSPTPIIPARPVRAYEWHDDSGNWFRSYGNENWEFNEHGLMHLRIASINDLPIKESERKYHWPLGRRPDDHPSLSDLGL